MVIIGVVVAVLVDLVVAAVLANHVRAVIAARLRDDVVDLHFDSPGACCLLLRCSYYCATVRIGQLPFVG